MSRTNFALDFDSNVRWGMQLRLKPSLMSSLIKAQGNGENIRFHFSADGSNHVLTLGDRTFNITCRGDGSNDHTICKMSRDWNAGRAKEVGIVKMRGDVQTTFEEKQAHMSAGKSTVGGNVGKRIREASKPAQPVGSKQSNAGKHGINTSIPSFKVLTPPRTDASSPPAQNAPTEHKESRGPSPTQRLTPAPLTGPGGELITKAALEAAAREAAKRGQLRACVLAYIAGNNVRIRRKASQEIMSYFREARKNGSPPGESIVEGVVKEVTQLQSHGLCLTPKAREELISKVLPSLEPEKGPLPPPATSSKPAKPAKKSKSPRATQGTTDAEPKAKKAKTSTKTPKSNIANDSASKAVRAEKQQARGAPAAVFASAANAASSKVLQEERKAQPVTASRVSKVCAYAQPKPRSDHKRTPPPPQPASKPASPSVKPPSPAAEPASPAQKPDSTAADSPKSASKVRMPPPPTPPVQLASARATPVSPAVTPPANEAAPEPAPEQIRTVRQSSPAPPKVPVDVLMPQYPPKVSAEMLEDGEEEEEEEGEQPLPAWCEAADEGADAMDEDAPVATTPASPASNLSGSRGPPRDVQMRDDDEDKQPSAAATRRRTRGQRMPDYREDSDDDFAIDQHRALASRPAQAAIVTQAAPYVSTSAEFTAAASVQHVLPVQRAAGMHMHAAAHRPVSVASAAPMLQPQRSSGLPPLHTRDAYAPCEPVAAGGMHARDSGAMRGSAHHVAAVTDVAIPQVAVPAAIHVASPRDSAWFREYAEGAAARQMGGTLPPLRSSAEVQQAYATYQQLVTEVQAQVAAIRAIESQATCGPLLPEQQQALQEFQVNQEYWQAASETLSVLHERLGHAHAGLSC